MFDAFLSIDGVDSESTRKGFEGQIEIQSFSIGAHNETSIGAGGGAGAGKVALSTMNVTKKTDAASPVLFQKCCEGMHFPKAEITLHKAGGEQLAFLKYAFDTIYVEDIQWSGSSGGDDVPMETLSLAFGKIEMTYTKQAKDGTAGAPVVASWDLTTVTK